MLRIDTRQTDNVTVLDLNGALMFGPESQLLAQHVKKLAAAQTPTDGDAPQVLIRLNELTCIDSCGVGELIASFTTVKKCGGVLKVCEAGARVAEVLRIVRLQALVDLYETEAEALASFA